MQIQFRCPKCAEYRESQVGEVGGSLTCGCGWSKTVVEADRQGQAPARCVVCSNQDLWRQKDLAPHIGLGCVIIQVVLSSVAWYYYEPLWTYGILMAFALLDMVLFQVLPDVLVCYRCQARHRSLNLGDRQAFDLQLAEKYRQEAIRLKTGD